MLVCNQISLLISVDIRSTIPCQFNNLISSQRGNWYGPLKRMSHLLTFIATGSNIRVRPLLCQLLWRRLFRQFFLHSHFAAHAQRQQSWAAWLAIKVSIMHIYPFWYRPYILVNWLHFRWKKESCFGHHVHETHILNGQSAPHWSAQFGSNQEAPIRVERVHALTPVCETSFFPSNFNPYHQKQSTSQLLFILLQLTPLRSWKPSPADMYKVETHAFIGGSNVGGKKTKLFTRDVNFNFSSHFN